MASNDCVRLAHFSDIHVMADACRWQARDWASKRLASWFNLRCLSRGRHFCRADDIVRALSAEVRERGIEHLVFSGDATALGFPEEVARAAELLRVGKDDIPPGLAVPGNHDYCTGLAQRSGAFERHFAPWQTGERVNGAIYPFAQRAGPVWLVGVNSAAANPWAWDASGLVGAEQLQRLESLLARLDDGPRVLVTHYPILNRLGAPERYLRKLRDEQAVLEVARKGGVRLWLHGHNHAPYYHAASAAAPFPIVCAGSATQEGLWSYGDCRLTTDRLEVQQRVFDPAAGRFQDGVSFAVELVSGEW